jgi:hypothetical protein
MIGKSFFNTLTLGAKFSKRKHGAEIDLFNQSGDRTFCVVLFRFVMFSYGAMSVIFNAKLGTANRVDICGVFESERFLVGMISIISFANN